jgi:hypothetical protein
MPSRLRLNPRCSTLEANTMSVFEQEKQKFFSSNTRKEERHTGPEAPKYWNVKYQEWLSLDEATYRAIAERSRG